MSKENISIMTNLFDTSFEKLEARKSTTDRKHQRKQEIVASYKKYILEKEENLHKYKLALTKYIAESESETVGYTWGNSKSFNSFQKIASLYEDIENEIATIDHAKKVFELLFSTEPGSVRLDAETTILQLEQK